MYQLNSHDNSKVNPTHTAYEQDSQWLDACLQALNQVVPNWQLAPAQLTHYLTNPKLLTQDPSYQQFDKFTQGVVTGICSKYQVLQQGYLLNHTTSKLSDLDLEMIQHIPPGGNWKDTAPATVAKSQRLTKITTTGGRTTLYGRINYSQPSYTITTYFNRPGNGTYVHPTHQRVITVREAARFQTFKDDYYFFGNKSQVLKQVGNAVPPILAYLIGKNITQLTGCHKSVDLFCGAGGFTVGFKEAGIHSIVSNDIEASACTTLKINNPEIPIICGDITNPKIKQQIIDRALQQKADIICGGPPCQGFSMTGVRAENDPRNQLFKDFIELVQNINPKVIVFENVAGMLSYQGGKTYQELHQMFADLGYRALGKLLNTSNYAIPQKRKRVVIICTRNNLDLDPALLFPVAITTEQTTKVTAKDTIFDLDNVPCGESTRYSSTFNSHIIKYFTNNLDVGNYITNGRV